MGYCRIDEAMPLTPRVPQPLAPILADSVKHRRIGPMEMHLLQPFLDQLLHRNSALPKLVSADGVSLSAALRD